MLWVPLPASVPTPTVVQVERVAEARQVTVVHPPALNATFQNLPVQNCHHQEPVGPKFSLRLT